MMHLSRLSEELILWCELGVPVYRAGQTALPPARPSCRRRKTPTWPSSCRGKTGRVYGDLMTLLTMLKGLPLAYNKDMQEDKEAVFDCGRHRRSSACRSSTPMLATMKP